MNGENKKVAVSITLPEDLVKEVNARAAKLDLNRSQYFRRLVRTEIESTDEKQPKLPGMAVAA